MRCPFDAQLGIQERARRSKSGRGHDQTHIQVGSRIGQLVHRLQSGQIRIQHAALHAVRLLQFPGQGREFGLPACHQHQMQALGGQQARKLGFEVQ